MRGKRFVFPAKCLTIVKADERSIDPMPQLGVNQGSYTFLDVSFMAQTTNCSNIIGRL